MRPAKKKPLKIHVGITGGVQVNADEFFAQPSVQKKRERMAQINIVEKSRNGTISSSKKSEKHST